MQPKEVSVVYDCRCQDILASLAFLRNKKAHVYIKYRTKLKKPLAQQLEAFLKTQPFIASVTLTTNLDKFKYKHTQWHQQLQMYRNYQQHHIVDCTHWMDPRWRAMNSLTGDARQWLFKIYNQKFYQQPFILAPKIDTPQYAYVAYQNRYQTVQDFSDIQLKVPTVKAADKDLMTKAILINNSSVYIGNDQISNWLAQGLGVKRYIAKSHGSDLISKYSFGGTTHLKQLLNADGLLKKGQYAEV